MVLDPVLQELIDKTAIRDVMTRYARSNDRRDFHLMASTFTTDAYANYGNWEERGVENIVNRLTYTRPHRATHFMGDQDVQIDGDSANVETLASDDALDDWVMRNVSTCHHISGTCKMGPESDDMAVVDQYGKVHGLEGLRVVDASIMPDCIRANTNVTTMMIGERVSDFIKQGL